MKILNLRRPKKISQTRQGGGRVATRNQTGLTPATSYYTFRTSLNKISVTQQNGPASVSYKIQRSAKVGAPGLVNSITAVAYYPAPVCLQHSRNLVHRL